MISLVNSQTFKEEIIPILQKLLENGEQGDVSQLTSAASINPRINLTINHDTQAAEQSKNARTRAGDATSSQL